MFTETELKGVRVFSFSEFSELPHFIYAVASRQTDFDLGHTRGTTGQVRKQGLCAALGIDPNRLFTLHQVHSADIVVLNESAMEDPDKELGPADGVIVTKPGLFAAVRTADCMPVVAAIPSVEKVILIHMGWRGAQQRILEKGLRKFQRVTGFELEEMVVSLGPCIRSCCYEVGDDVRRAFQEAGFRREEVFREDHLDLVAAARIQITQCGARTVLDSDLCTACRTDLFYSYRREATSSRMWTLSGFLQ
jgi:YfiH family protein